MMYESPITFEATDSALAAPTSHPVETKVLSPVRLDLPSTYGLTSTYMPEYDQQTSGTDDSQPEWQTSTVKSEDLAYSPASSDGDSSFAPLTVVESPTSSTDSQIPRRKSFGKGGRKRSVEKGTHEYVEKRARNNVAVRKSRAKAKEKQKSTESKVSILLSENEKLQKKVDLLTKELNVLKGLFINVGTAIPDSFAKLLEQ
ncbi:CCAAT/enhancer-binding protein gamma-like [Gigantopelta aegis]|uniref:CCAAT/enhancer-binding protein gamma-like n=1 Tax=Gigantopelta aegis TaxID=1735272 RepID=UPI001B889035|nr:CCAAT/enhancer-binding protein gamma-like [Gigantopelta aegis]